MVGDTLVGFGIIAEGLLEIVKVGFLLADGIRVVDAVVLEGNREGTLDEGTIDGFFVGNFRVGDLVE